jgi:hypothetical protein
VENFKNKKVPYLNSLLKNKIINKSISDSYKIYYDTPVSDMTVASIYDICIRYSTPCRIANMLYIAPAIRDSSLFGEGNATTSSGSEAKLAEDFGWWGSFYAIAQGRLTDFEKIEKLNFNACLTYLSFEKQKNEIEQKRIKHARQNRTH